MNKTDKTAAARAGPSKFASVEGQLGVPIVASLVTDPSGPAAATAVTPAMQMKPASGGRRTSRSMSLAQASSRMPRPGQNIDHSAALSPVERANGLAGSWPARRRSE